MLKNMAKVLVVGAGMTGTASAAMLKQIPEIASIVVWDKGRGAGGRMSTARCPEDGSITADLGAQYITLTQEYSAKRQSLYNELTENGVLTPMKGSVEGPNNFDQPGSQHFVTPQGVSSLVKYFLKKSETAPKYQHTVSDVSFTPENGVKVSTKEDASENFDIVVLSLPVPQILQLTGSVHDAIASQGDIRQNLEAVSYSSRYALAMFYPPGQSIDVPWTARYLESDPVIRYMAVDQAKRGAVSPGSGQSLVVHTHVPYGLSHLEDDMESVKAEVTAQVRRVLPGLPQELSAKIQRWRYSQVHKAYKDTPGCVVLSDLPLVILAGDAFSHSTFDGCLDSAEAVLRAVQESLGQKKQKLPNSGL